MSDPLDRPSGDTEDRQPGLARERTELAWTRTAVSFAALGTAMLRTSTGTGLVVMVTGAAVYGVGRLSTQRYRFGGARHAPLVITVVTTVVSLVAFALALSTGLRARG
jgi:Domain of unknown function (DUF202)